MPIGPAVAELSFSGWNPCLYHFDVFDDFVLHFPHVKATGKSAVFQLVSRASRHTPATPFLDVNRPQFVPYGVCKFQPATANGSAWA